MSVVEKLEEAIKNLREFVKENRIMKDVLEDTDYLRVHDVKIAIRKIEVSFVAFKKDYIIVKRPDEMTIKHLREVAKALLIETHVIVSRKKLEDWLEAEQKLEAKEQSIAENVLKKILGIEPL